MRGKMLRATSGAAPHSAGRTRWELAALVGCLVVALAAAPALARGNGGMGGGSFSFAGPIEALPASGLVGDWTVGRATVHVTTATTIDQSAAAAAVGAIARVSGTPGADGSINATTIVIQSNGMSGPPAGGPVTLFGAIGSLPATQGWIGDWTVRGVTVHVTFTTTIDQTNGTVAVGAPVLVQGTQQSDRSINAASIKVEKTPPTAAKTVSFCGVVKSLPASGLIGEWTVNGVTVQVDGSTTIDQSKGTVAVDVSVRVAGELQADASVNATAIVVKADLCGAFNPPASMSFSVLHLTPTADAPSLAEGVVLTRQMTFADGSTREDLKVAVEHLLPATAYEVMIDTIDAGPIMTDAAGEGQLFLSTADIPGAAPLPSDLQDFSTLVQVDVNDSGGTTMLTGKFADAKTSDREGPGLDFLGVAVLKDQTAQVVGMATASVKGSLQELSLTVWGLTPGQAYTLAVDTTTVGDLTASSRGRVEAEYSTAPSQGDLQLPDALVPVSTLMHVELQGAGGTVVASGDLQTVANPTASVVGRLVKRMLHH